MTPATPAETVALQRTGSQWLQRVGGLFYRHPQVSHALLAGVAGVFFLLFFIYPLGGILKLAFYKDGVTLAFFRQIFLDPSGLFVNVGLTTFRSAALVTVLTFLLGYPLASLMLVLTGKWQKVLMVCVILPFWTSVLVRTYAWMVLLGRHGLINGLLVNLGLIDQPVQLLYNTTGTLIGMTHIMLPYMIFPLYSVMRNIDPQLMAAAYILGARPFQAFWRVFFPLSLPGVFGGGLLVFIISLGFFITPALMGGQKDLMIAVLIERRVMEYLQWGLSAALSVTLLAATLLLVLLVRRFMKVEKLFGGR